MNRWKTKKKAKEAEAAAASRGASTDSDPPALPVLKHSKTFRLGGRKAPEPTPKPELDIGNALPSNDDFRTSLLMSGLSARFSMLREQDDPNSKIGKASDDSVLFPKRQSRLNDFGFQSNGLSDIAEVSSINGSIKPPFAFGRTDSYHEGYGTDDDSTHSGSIMSRRKPGEGNNLFGGRQKIYKISNNAAGSSKNLTEGGTTGGGMGGRALYENDVSQSAFQKLREQEREQDREEREEGSRSRPSSPTFNGYNRNRETSSTTSSAGPSNTRSSTAATSVTSQRTPSLTGTHTPISPGLERTTTKGRRLYETGLDQHLHEQQHSAMSRIDNLSRQRTLGVQTPPPGGNSPNGLNAPGDRWDRPVMAGKQSMPNLRGASPPPSVTPLSTFDFDVKPSNAIDGKAYGVASPPLSPTPTENDLKPVLPVQPNDRGKATAMGTFMKPVQPYDENKYTQRQLQMQQGRETPPLRKNSPPRGIAPRPPQQQPQQPQMGRNRGESNATFASNRSRSNSSVQRNFLPQDRIPESPSRPQINIPASSNGLPSSPFPSSPRGHHTNYEQHQSPNRGAQHPHDLPKGFQPGQRMNLERPPESQHPANRSRPFQHPAMQNYQPAHGSDFAASSGRGPVNPDFAPQATSLNLATSPVSPPADSPTLGPTSGLSGMVRQHLRSDSNTSSIYGGAPSAGLISRFPDTSPSEPLPASNEYASRNNNPWETDDWDRGYDDDFSVQPAQTYRSGKTENVSQPTSSMQSPSVDSPGQVGGKPSWETEVELHHARNSSTETQKERQDFQNELAMRRRQVKENLKSFVETESHSVSPLPTTDTTKDGPFAKNSALGLLKNKSSRGSLAGRPKENVPTKSMRMLGIGSPNTMGSVSPAKQTFEDNAWKHEEEQMTQEGAQSTVIPPQTKAFRQARRDAQRDRERQMAARHQQKFSPEPNDPQWTPSPIENVSSLRNPSKDRYPPNIRTEPREPSKDRKPPPITISHRNGSSQEGSSRAPSRTSRDRSSSDASRRSKSRNGRYRDDLAKAMAEGTSSSNQGVYDELDVPVNRFIPKSPATPNSFQPPIPSPMAGPNARSRSNSKSTPAGYFDPQSQQALQNLPEIGQPSRPPPGAPGFVANPTPPLIPAQGTASGTTTPTAGFPPQGKTMPPRKRSINKSEISEPKLISSTSRITTVDLPPGSSLQNGSEQHNAPPIPPVNPRRRQTRAMFGAFIGRKEDSDDLHTLPAATQSTEEMSTFSGDEGDAKPKTRQKLRKSSSEGGNLNARARQAAFAAPSPALPTGTFPPTSETSSRPTYGGMF